MKARGSPKTSSGLTFRPSTITSNSDSMPIAAWRNRFTPADSVRPPFLTSYCFRKSVLMIAVPHAVLGLFAGRVARHERDVAEVEVQVVIGEPDAVAVRARPESGERLRGDAAVALDLLA